MGRIMQSVQRFAVWSLALGGLSILGGCAIATPFKSTEPGRAVCRGDAVVSVTEARVKPDAASREVFWRNVRAIESALPE
jgi:hypothetical protein